jgi:hypothetical protein
LKINAEFYLRVTGFSLNLSPSPATSIMKLQLPKGKITIRHRQQRNVYQCFAGRAYLDGASGDNGEQAAQELANHYNVPENTKAIIHGYNHPIEIIIPSSEN